MEQKEKEWSKKFDKKFYKNHSTRQWLSKAGESYRSEHPQMGRAELLEFISNLLADQKKEIVGRLEKYKRNDFREDGFCTEGNKLRTESNKLRAEGDKLKKI